MAKNTRVMPPDETLKRRSLKKDSWSIGCLQRASQTPKATRRATAAAKVPSVVALPQPCTGASMMAYTSVPRATIDSPAPTRSSGACDGSLDLGTRK